VPPLASLASLVLAAALSAAIAGAAYAAGSLNRSGALAAFVVGTIAVATGAAWGGYLVTWFALTSLLSRLGRERKARHVAAIVAKGGARDARQVFANGGVFALAALGTWWFAPQTSAHALLAAAGAAALAAAGADTWATEVGTWARATAWSLRTGRRVVAGTSGAISLAGTAGLAAGALLWTLAAMWLGVIEAAAIPAVLTGALAGATMDTLLGAWAQARRWCDRCNGATEQVVHVCGAATRVAGGVRWLDNDAVNLAATVTGALVAMALAR
jgi:uncharacterized protein (TIGR00297 family)